MKVDQRALDAIEVKLHRADELFRVLYAEMLEWSNRTPWRLVPEVRDGGRVHFWRLMILDPMPVVWAVMLGEAIHDLRSALDQCVYWLSVDWTRREVDGSGFPVYASKAAFHRRSRRDPSGWARDGGMWKIRGIGPGPVRFIEALQPYPQRRLFYCRAVRTVHDLSNLDKHRLVHLWGLRFEGSTVDVAPQVLADCDITIDPRIRYDRDIVYKARCRTPHTSIRLRGSFGADIAFTSGRRSGGGRESLWDTGVTISDIVGKLVRAIGRQDEFVNAAIWSARADSPGL